MKKIVELFKVKAIKGDVGVEIEVEGKGLKEVFTDVWKTEIDGSLRGRYPNTCAEFILARPIPVGAVEAAIINLKEELKGAEFDFSYRTSVHTHVNVQHLEFQQLLAMLYTYYLLEEPLMTFAGKKRKGNNFCLRLQDAEGVLNVVTKLFEFGEQGTMYVKPDQVRYSAMNIEALRKYGSVEFRGMEGNIDEKRIQKLCTALVRIREYGVKQDTPEAVYERFSELGSIPFMQEVLGDIADDFHYARAEKDMLVSFSISLDLPFAFKRLLAKPKKEKGVLEEGGIVDYDTAIKLIRAGGHVEAHEEEEGMYVIIDLPKPKVKKVAWPAGAFNDIQLNIDPVNAWAVAPVQGDRIA